MIKHEIIQQRKRKDYGNCFGCYSGSAFDNQIIIEIIFDYRIVIV